MVEIPLGVLLGLVAALAFGVGFLVGGTVVAAGDKEERDAR